MYLMSLNKNTVNRFVELESKRRSESLYLKQEFLPPPKDNVSTATAYNTESNTKSEIAKVKTTPKTDNKSTNTRKNSIFSRLSNQAMNILNHLAINKIPKTTKQIKDRLNIKSGSIINRVKNELLMYGLTKLYKIQVAKTYLLIWALTDKAYELMYISRPVRHGKGGDLHCFVQENLHQPVKELGYHNTKIEYFLDDGKAVDFVASNGTELLFFEVSLPPLEKELINIKKDFSASQKPDKLIMLVKNSKDKKKLIQLIESDMEYLQYQDKISVELIGDYVNE